MELLLSLHLYMSSLGIELWSSGLCHKHFYLLSHLTRHVLFRFIFIIFQTETHVVRWSGTPYMAEAGLEFLILLSSGDDRHVPPRQGYRIFM